MDTAERTSQSDAASPLVHPLLQNGLARNSANEILQNGSRFRMVALRQDGPDSGAEETASMAGMVLDDAIAICKRRSSSITIPPVMTVIRQSTIFTDDVKERINRERPTIREFLASSYGLLFQLTLVLMVIAAYALSPNLVGWSMPQIEDLDHPGKTKQGQNYFAPAVLAFSAAVNFLICAILLVATGGCKELQLALSPSKHLAWIVPAFGYGVSDSFEVLSMSAGGVDATTYILLSQGKLVLTALVLLVFFGREQSQVGWCMILGISSSMIGYSLDSAAAAAGAGAAGEGGSEGAGGHPARGFKWAGILCIGVKVILSVTCGCIVDQKMKTLKAPFLRQMVFIRSFGYGAAALLVLWAQVGLVLSDAERASLDWSFGGLAVVFEGPDGPWTWKTVVLGVWYCMKDLAVFFLLKRLDVIVKNIADALSLFAAYFLAVAVFKSRQASAICLIWVAVVALQVLAFSLDKLNHPLPGPASLPPSVVSRSAKEAGTPKAGLAGPSSFRSGSGKKQGGAVSGLGSIQEQRDGEALPQTSDAEAGTLILGPSKR
uniref:Uncharacterized protein n=1 Tax=Chromera velia CCMP2878 TaxID=1169474 RepID=A0A0G4HV37_9ALVE|eukprot:Cvel_8726.t1-p1 / transcript=Cvel_8726.t1 / gene=Cvel_8726 / organism=Chromera_velia_CCMP2878 / gene_product=hypothetical protein / transcript_product=hypothetical protein / location=Cvel_scaffold488:4459-9277(-) / protein_length=547 / sequence_SO=supercontig / SO=protein_coding / is_pseudo=false